MTHVNKEPAMIRPMASGVAVIRDTQVLTVEWVSVLFIQNFPLASTDALAHAQKEYPLYFWLSQIFIKSGDKSNEIFRSIRSRFWKL